MTRAVASPHVLTIADLRRLAQKRLPRIVFDYIDGGAEAEITLRENARAYQQVTGIALQWAGRLVFTDVAVKTVPDDLLAKGSDLLGQQIMQTKELNGFNMLNAATVLGRQTRQNFAQANYVTSILAPRVIRFGVKVNF